MATTTTTTTRQYAVVSEWHQQVQRTDGQIVRTAGTYYYAGERRERAAFSTDPRRAVLYPDARTARQAAVALRERGEPASVHPCPMDVE